MKRLLTFALLLVISFPMLAERVDQQKALKVAETVLQHKALTPMPLGQFNNLYVFNSENSFVLVAADDCARPVLGYSKEFAFKTENMPENVREWLTLLNDEIQDAVDRKLEATEEIRQEWDLLLEGKMPEPKNRSAVGPLVQTHWDQYPPYNNMCPSGTFTGCVATAMSQLMKYWEWPHHGVGNHSYNHSIYGNISANFASTTYDWDNMLAEVYEDSPTVQQNAVATLAYHCGVSVDMDYGPESSAAFTEEVVNALGTYFDYNQDDLRLSRASEYGTGWVTFVKSELNQGRPMLYRGQGDGGGHAFICDGYDSYDYLHFNWGWGGYCDGFYAYGALDPGTGGAGAGSGSFNNNNFAITGAHPNTPPISAPGNLTVSTFNRSVALHWSAVSGASHYKVYCDGFVINNNVTGTVYSDTNPYYGYHTYYVKAVNANGICSLSSEVIPVELTYPGPIATNVTANVQGNNVRLSWTAPAAESGQLKYGDGTPANSCYGSSSGTGFTWGQRYGAERLVPYAGMAITSVDIYFPVGTTYTLDLYKEDEYGDFISLASGDFLIPSSGWWAISMPEPIPLDYLCGLWVVLYNDNSEYQYVAAYTENYEGSEEARLYVGSDGYWKAINNNISWLIRTNVSDGEYTYSIYRNDQLIATDIAQTYYNDNGLPDGFYEYSVRTQYYDELSEPSHKASALIGHGVEENEDNPLTVYPNPVNDKVTVRCEDMASVSVMSITGQQIITVEANGDQVDVDMANIPSGVYVLMVRANDGVSHFTRIAKH